jgi:hypothetical protein
MRRSLLPATSRVEALTPRSLVAVLRAGYELEIHASAGGAEGSTAVGVQATTNDDTHQ